ncbi:MAG: 3-methyl-2-oxobutanoate hydroxymethyltransferase [Desulfovibrio sp.]
MPKRMTAPDVLNRKGQKPLTMMTAYDYPSALIADSAGVDMILVGDSLGMVVLGYDDTLSVTMDDMIHHTKAASRGAKQALIVGDMPFMSYNASVEDAVRNAGRFLQETDARAVKLEGGKAVLKQVKAIADAGIPVMGHLGLTPQHVARFGGFKAQGKTAHAVAEMLKDALALQEAGAFGIVLEAVPHEAAQMITEKLDIPTIGIGAGNSTDGQVLVFHDTLGLFDRFVPKFVKQYDKMGPQAVAAIEKYCEEVESRAFPAPEHTFYMAEEELETMKFLTL